MEKVILDFISSKKVLITKFLVLGVMLGGLNYSYFNIEQKVKSNNIQKAKAESILIYKNNLKFNSKIAASVIGIKNNENTYSGLSKKQAMIVLEIKNNFGDKLFRKAVAIAWCESRLNSTAFNKNRNGSADRGVFQLNDGGTMQGLGITSKEAYDFYANIRAAKALYNNRGWQPWVCAKKMSHKI